ncbi:MAG: MFS transporter [Gammaproteobacteria bacterium]|nr:MFS transporter [Gammaproteobacteria bacterium]
MMTCNALLVTTSALVGYTLAADKAYATLPYALQLVATMCTSIPAALLMKKIGRKAGFMLATLLGMSGGSLCTLGILHGQFLLFIAGGCLIGMFNGFGNYYRFTAADAVDVAHKSRAISLVLAGGVIAAIAGPNLANLTRELIDRAMFAGSYAAIIGIYILALIVLSFLKLPPQITPSHLAQGAGRRLRHIVAQPRYIVAVISGMFGYGVMALVMTATPLAMHQHAYPFADTSFVIQWHVLGMYVPSFFTGHLIHRFGSLRIVLVGALAGLACVAINLAGTTVTHFWIALTLLGISWNFLFIGATSLLTETYTREETFKAQAVNEFIIFSTVAAASLSAGALQHLYGWQAVNIGAIVPLAIILLSVLWLVVHKQAYDTNLDESILEQAINQSEQ